MLRFALFIGGAACALFGFGFLTQPSSPDWPVDVVYGGHAVGVLLLVSGTVLMVIAGWILRNYDLNQSGKLVT